MHKLSFIIATLAIVLTGCSKDESVEQSTSFVKGQKMTLTASVENNATRVSSSLTSGTFGFKWEATDVGKKAKVKVGTKTAEFTLKDVSTDGASATFEGFMPASGDTYDIQYPSTEPSISTQTYTSTGLPNSSLCFAAAGCTPGSAVTLLPKNAILNLNFYGADITTKKIVVRQYGESTNNSYTLDITGGKTLGTASAEATPFYILMPTGEYKFFVELYDNSSTPQVISVFAVTSKKTFAANSYQKMSSLSVNRQYVNLGLSVYWANCNIGSESVTGSGDYYAWGETRYYYDSLDPLSFGPFSNGYSELTYSGSEYFTEWSPAPYGSDKILKSSYDVATYQKGSPWRMPKSGEFQELLNNCTWIWTKVNGVNGCIVASNVSGYKGYAIFLPAVGQIMNNYFVLIDSDGYYWSSSRTDAYESGAQRLQFDSGHHEISPSASRYCGLPVRPVLPASL